MKKYSLRLEGNSVTMDLGLLYSAIQSRKVDMIAANSKDGLISALPRVCWKMAAAAFRHTSTRWWFASQRSCLFPTRVGSEER